MYAHDHNPSPRPPASCLDCGQHDRHDDSCPGRHDLLDLVESDLAALAARVGRPYTRLLHRVELAILEACGCTAPRHERDLWTVEVRPIAGGVRRRISRAGRPVAELDDVAVGAL